MNVPPQNLPYPPMDMLSMYWQTSDLHAQPTDNAIRAFMVSLNILVEDQLNIHRRAVQHIQPLPADPNQQRQIFYRAACIFIS